MNYWVTPSGQVFQGQGMLSWHSEFCDFYLDEHKNVLARLHEWWRTNDGYIHEFFEDELKWVRYCGWTTPPKWIVDPTRRLTKKQKERIFELTGDIF